MINFEGYSRRIDKINSVLGEYGIESLEAAQQIVSDNGIDVRSIVLGIQPIAFENAVWAYTVGAAIAIKAGAKNAAEALPPASVTKIMTLLLVMEAIDAVIAEK